MLYSSIPATRREIASVVHFHDRSQIAGQLRLRTLAVRFNSDGVAELDPVLPL
jgi:hypothetical protein